MKKIPLRSRKYPGLFATVDDDTFVRLSKFKWFPYVDRQTTYAIRNIYGGDGSHTTTSMHQDVIGKAPGLVIDHIDGDGLNNSRTNLRHCTQSKNVRNRKTNPNTVSGLKGCSWFASTSTWRARITVNKKTTTLGYFKTKEEAYAAYCAASHRFHGEYGRTS